MIKEITYKEYDGDVTMAENGKKKRKLHRYIFDGGSIFKIEKDIEKGLIASGYDPEKGFIELDYNACDIMKSGSPMSIDEYKEIKAEIDEEYEEEKKKKMNLSPNKNERV